MQVLSIQKFIARNAVMIAVIMGVSTILGLRRSLRQPICLERPDDGCIKSRDLSTNEE